MFSGYEIENHNGVKFISNKFLIEILLFIDFGNSDFFCVCFWGDGFSDGTRSVIIVSITQSFWQSHFPFLLSLIFEDFFSVLSDQILKIPSPTTSDYLRSQSV
jgi:hypothetical protein